MQVGIEEIYKDDLLSVPDYNKTELKFHNPLSNGVLLIVSDELQDADTEMLGKMVAALSCKMEDTGMLICSDNDQIIFKELINSYKIDKIIGFGIKPVDIFLQLDPKTYQIFNFQTVSLLFSDSLAALHADKSMKAKLWASLQLMFNVKK